MTILNLMLGRKRGGLEQAAIDYAEALAVAKIPSLTVIGPSAWAEAPLVAAGMRHQSLITHGRLDPFAAHRLRAVARSVGASAIICHGNRALTLALRAFSGRMPVIAVAHNYNTRRFAKADACFSITHHLATHLAAGGAKNIHWMPNMVRSHICPARTAFENPPVIGSMGRLVAKKGFASWVEALAVLRSRGVAFRAVLGGDGEEADAIDALIARYQLHEHITRSGWVSDKAAFFRHLDLFVLPSLHEPFGIALIEAMSYRVPVISTDSEGPSEILYHGVDGILVPKRAPEALADAIAAALADPATAIRMGEAGAVTVATHYSIDAMAGRLQTALAPYMKQI